MSEHTSNVLVGILSRDDISNLIHDEGVRLLTDHDDDCLQGCSYDLRIGTIFRNGEIIKVTQTETNRYINVEPGEIVSLLTLEELNLPIDIMATAFAINAQSREGLMVLNPGHVDPGFSGPLSVKAINLRKAPLPVRIGDPIFTVIFEKLPKQAPEYKGNESRAKREAAYNKKDLEVSPKGLSEILRISKDCPFALEKDVRMFRTEAEVKQIITVHWTTLVTLILAGVAAIAGLYSVFGRGDDRIIEHHYFGGNPSVSRMNPSNTPAPPAISLQSALDGSESRSHVADANSGGAISSQRP